MRIHFNSLLAAVLLLLFALAAGTALCAATAESAILFIGDGMGPMHIFITRAFVDREHLVMESLPYAGSATTHCADSEVTDSAAAGTALATGVKTNDNVIGLAPDGRLLTTIMERAMAQGKATGIITTDALWGATPAAFAAHVPSRDEYAEIASQLAAAKVEVLMGFDKDYFLPKSTGGKREDLRNLIIDMKRNGYTLVETKEQLSQPVTGRLLGLFSDDTDTPTITQMFEAAYARLSQDPDGFMLMVEGARIDWRSHANDPAGVVLEVSALDNAVASAMDHARKEGDILVVVTADHETGGLAVKDIYRVAALRNVTQPVYLMAAALNPAKDNAQQALAKGAGMTSLTPRELTLINKSEDPDQAIASVISERAGLSWTGIHHTAARVPVFAYGPGGDKFQGEMDNTDIPKRITEALGIAVCGN